MSTTLTAAPSRRVYLLHRSIQLNQTVSLVPVHCLPRPMRPHLCVVLWSDSDNANKAFKVELWVDDDNKHRAAFGIYPSLGMNLESQHSIGETTWSYLAVVHKAIEIVQRGPPYDSNRRRCCYFAPDRQHFADEMAHEILDGSSPSSTQLKTETGGCGIHNYTSQTPFVHAKPGWAKEDWTVSDGTGPDTAGVAVLSGPAGPGRSTK
ncbi:hypothetical protein C8R47DRAFT_1319103 [Mycena vitilis]|nr:hypothetical protein C8R47DRAFT_1319103 [Mycena vitilis]